MVATIDRYVATFRASGNVVFADGGTDAKLSSRISESELDLNAIAATASLTTMRAKGTVDQIAAKHFG